ncbi:uncharacterized protein FYW47_014758 [Aplochiton taeniatus]
MEEEAVDVPQQFHSDSLCGVCTICAHCKSCNNCPCEEGDESVHCSHCDGCSYCYLCPVLCDTICTPGGLVDELTGSLFGAISSFL